MTQSECKERFFDLVSSLIDAIDEIDDDTPWADREPKWWIEMMNLRQKSQSILDRK